MLMFSVTPENQKERRYFRLVPTGWDFNDEHLEYLGIVQGGSFVWHVFERKKS